MSSEKKKPKKITFTLEWTVDAEDVLDGIDGVHEALTAHGSVEVTDCRVSDKE